MKLEALEASNEVGACHCSMCRGWSGGPFIEVDCGTFVEFTGQDSISVYDSSPWAERGFCSNCGTHLFYRIKQTGQTIVPVGIFPADDALTFKRQVFIDEKPHYYSFAEETQDLTGEQVFAMFGGGD
ncbi:GFA family protein [Altererythrobacter arenosus]|uniref:GFA family protein n=1 Tax=Altererythrobacter arenosus TaxID=3032592 RepID=A0ABY8FP59_9SPHN|nr:GFA family protein [Altererythrobacter sp. CAU 1644]WFL76796.1 GFA family protein [Altererythrobacter sp. CAU 1644]